MNIGPKIRELRLKAGLTQKNLADTLYVTYQAVSRWEKGDTEPSFDTLKKMCEIFNCSMDEMFDFNKPLNEDNESLLAHNNITCNECGKHISDPSDLVVIENEDGSKTYLCVACHESKLRQINDSIEEHKMLKKEEDKKRRIIGSLASLVILFTFVIFGAISFVKSDNVLGIVLCVTGLVLFFFTSTMVLNNSFVSDLWHRVIGWNISLFKKTLYKFSFDNKVFLVFTKIIFFIVEFGVAIFSFVLVTVLCMLFSIFAYPSALLGNLKSA